MTINYELGYCAYGKILAARTNLGLCAVSLGECDLVAALKTRFQKFDCQPGEAGLHQVLASVEDPTISYSGVLDLHGTDFQRRVWDEIRKVNYAHVVTYAWLAEAIKQPTTYRAVAQACSNNPVAVIVPCHRVVGMAGIGGYRWGTEIKQRLLNHEVQPSVATA